MKKGPILKGLSATLILLSVYFIILTLVSGWDFAKAQFADFGFFVVSLAVGFGVQIGLYVYLKQILHAHSVSKGVVVATGSTSTVAMISCCAHYLVTILPILGVTGFVALVSQYQLELFWVGIVSNFVGVFYISNKFSKFSKQSSL